MITDEEFDVRMQDLFDQLADRIATPGNPRPILDHRREPVPVRSHDSGSSGVRRGRWMAMVAAASVLGLGVVAVATRDGSVHRVAPAVPTDGGDQSGSTAATVDETVAATTVPRTLPVATTVGVDGSPLSQSITIGAVGSDVTRLQQRLTDLGFALGPVNGVFGESTQQAVWAFKKLVGRMSYQELVDDPRATEVNNQWWAQMIGPVTIEPRRPEGGGTHVEVYLPSQVLVVFAENKPVLIAHISSGQLDDQGHPVLWCETVTYDIDEAGQPISSPMTASGCAESKTPGGVFKVSRRFVGNQRSPLGGMYNPVFFNYGVAIYGADYVPREPASHGAIRIDMNLADVFPTLVHDGDTVYVWGHDGKEPEAYTRQESLPSFTFRNPDSASTVP